MSTSFAIVLGIYAAGAVVGLICWLPYYLGNRRWVGQLVEAHREQYGETVSVHNQWAQTKGHLERNRAELQTTAGNLTRVEKQRDSLRGRSFELANKVRSLEQSAEQLRGELSQTAEHLRLSEDLVGKLRGEIAARDAEFETQKREWRSQRSELESQRSSVQAEVARLRGEIESHETAGKQRHNDWGVERTRLEESLADARSAMGDVRSELSRLKDEIAGQTEQWRKDRSGLETDLDAAKAEVGKLHDQVRELRDREHHLAAERDGVAGQLRSFEERFAAAEHERSAVRAEFEQSVAEVTRLADLNAQLEARASELAERALAAPAVSAPIAVAASLSGAAHVAIGLDFGANSTKVVVRGDDQPNLSWVVRWDEPATGYSSFASPTLVRMDDGKLYFGSKALQARQGQLFLSLKRDLTATAQQQRERHVDSNLAAEFAAIYLAWTLRGVRAVLGVEPAKIALHVGMPATNANDHGLADRFRRVIQAAWELAFRADGPAIEQGIPFENVASQVRELLDRPLPPQSDRSFRVLPEAMGPILSLAKDHAITGAESVMVLDMGSEQTELSIHSLSEFDDGIGAIRCVSAKTLPIGGQHFVDNDAAGRSVDGHGDVERQMVQSVADGLRDIVRRELEANKKSHSVQVVKVGGGLRRRCVESAIDGLIQLPESTSSSVADEGCRARWHIPSEMSCWNRDISLPVEEIPMFASAHGLSVLASAWPKFESSSENSKGRLMETADVESNSLETL